jgi:hypothetical protein
MSASLIVNRRVVVAVDAFAEIIVWRLPAPMPGCTHPFKYRLAYVVQGRCVLRYDNERGKGDHRHAGSQERPYRFDSPRALMRDFFADLNRWNHEHGRP